MERMIDRPDAACGTLPQHPQGVNTIRGKQVNRTYLVRTHLMLE